MITIALTTALFVSSGAMTSRGLELHEDQACFDSLGRLGRCFLACNNWHIDPDTNFVSHLGPSSCRFACTEKSTGHVVSCGHYCDDASGCTMALMDPDLIVYPGGEVPGWLVPVFEDTDPYTDVPIASGMYGVP